MRPVITSTGLDDLVDYFERMPDISTEAAMYAINDTARGDAMKLARNQILDEVNFPASYLNKARLRIGKLARRHDLEAIITGRDRPTSLARFVTGGAKPGQKGVMVEVHKGSVKTMKKGFIVRLRSGQQIDGQSFNLGLAIRLAPGEKIENKKFAGETFATSSLGSGVVLLYGPSVDQVFRWVAGDIQPEVGESVSREFLRQFARLSAK